MTHYDLIAIGSGSGGSAVANRAASYGAKVAVVEGGVLAGTCVNEGCVPKKLTWYAARVSEVLNRYGEGYGFTTENTTFDYKRFLENRNGYIERSRTSYHNNFIKNGVEWIQGYARFVNNHEIEVNGKRYTANHIVIATGGQPTIPENIKGAELVDTSSSFFKWTELPKTVAIVGAGYIAVELAGALNALGVETHLILRYDRPLRNFDTMLTDALVKEMTQHNIILHPYTELDEYRKHQNQIECYQKGERKLIVDKVILAVGRRPNTQHLGLEHTDVAVSEKGHILVDKNHETTAKGVYAIGDVIGKVDLTPVAIRAGRQLAEWLYHQAETAEIDYQNIPTVVFSHPPIGTIGLTEDQAVKQYGKEHVKVYTSTFFSMYVSGSGHRQPCHFKLVCVGENEKIIGLHGIGEGVDEMIQGFGVAIKMGATKKDIDSVVAIHPTGSEEFVTMR